MTGLKKSDCYTEYKTVNNNNKLGIFIKYSLYI